MSATAVVTERGLGRGCRRKARKILKRLSRRRGRHCLHNFYFYHKLLQSWLPLERFVAFFCKVLMMAIYQRMSSFFFMTIIWMKQENAFWLVLSCDPLEDRHIDHVNGYFFNQIKQMHSMLPWVCRKCVKNISDTLSCASCATLQFLSNFYDIYNPLLNRRTKTQNL